MAYSLTYSGGSISISNGTLNTSTSLALPGRNYAGYGSSVDQNMLSMLEHFASATSGPVNAIKGQVWFDASVGLLKVNTSSILGSPTWVVLAPSDGVTDVSFGDIASSGNITSAGNITASSGTILGATVNSNGNMTAVGTILGATVNSSGNITASGTVAGANVTATGTVSGGTVSSSGNVTAVGTVSGAAVNTTVITTGASGTAGTITGNWSLSSGSRLNATYADLAERFEADASYDAGTVVEFGGDKEITAVNAELSDSVLGVISDTAGYLMNSAAGDDISHPAIAMSGRVQVKVLGKVKKFDRLVSAGFGYARAAKGEEATPFNVIGRALESKNTDGAGKILAAVSAKI
jgi:hypothetical protein